MKIKLNQSIAGSEYAFAVGETIETDDYPAITSDDVTRWLNLGIAKAVKSTKKKPTEMVENKPELETPEPIDVTVSANVTVKEVK